MILWFTRRAADHPGSSRRSASHPNRRRGRIEAAHEPRPERVSVILPVLNETARIQACLECLMAQPEAVAEILVVDGGSSDGTQSMVERYRLTGPTRAVDRCQPGSRRLDRQNVGPLRGVEEHRCTVTVGSLYRCRCTLLAATCAFLCWLMPNEPAFQLFRLRRASIFPV